MVTTIIFIILYIIWVRTFIEMARIGKSLFLPDFAEIGKAYSYVGYNWNSWHGKFFYYIGLIFNLTVFLIVAAIVLFIIAGIIALIFGFAK